MTTLDALKKVNGATFVKGDDIKTVSGIRQVKDDGKMIWVCNPDFLDNGGGLEWEYLDVAIDALEVRGYTLQNN